MKSNRNKHVWKVIPLKKEEIIIRQNYPDPTLLYNKYQNIAIVVKDDSIIDFLKLCNGKRTLEDVFSRMHISREGLLEIYNELKEKNVIS